MTITTLLRFNLRYYREHFILSLLCVLGISLGVGIIIAVELINDSALTSFSSSVDFLSGKSTHSIFSTYGRLDEKAFADIWKNPDVAAASPIVETMASTVETGLDSIRFLGLDPLLDSEFRGLIRGRGEGSLRQFFDDSGVGVFLDSQLMEKYRLSPGSSLTVLTAGIEKKVKIAGSIPDASRTNQENLAVMDISAAQEIFGKAGYLDRIDVIVPEHADRFAKSLPESLRVTDANSRKSTLKAMLYSFQLNLAAMSLLALFVGVFLIYNFSMFSVLSRREDISLLLTLGADRKSMVCAFLIESSILAAIGSLFGVLFGYLIAFFSISRVSSTITDLYFYVKADTVNLTFPIVMTGMAVGFLATMIGTGFPALEVAYASPILGMKRQSIEDKAHGVKNWLLAGGAALFLLAVAFAWASRFSIFWGFASAFAMTSAFALFTPSLLSKFCHTAGIAFRNIFGSLTAFLAARMVRASLSRTSVAVAALATALSMTIGVDTMIHSFRTSVAKWLEGSLRGDLYVSPSTTKWDHPLPDELIKRVGSDPRVAAVEKYSTHEVLFHDKPIKLRVLDAAVLEKHSGFSFLKGAEGAWEKLKNGQVFISESLGFRYNLSAGDSLTINTPQGKKSFLVAAVDRDYSYDQGTIQIDRQVYLSIWNDSRVQSIALFIKPGFSFEEIRHSIVSEFPGLDRTIASNEQMRQNILIIFDKTFAPTSTLKGVSLLVALLGVATALMAILMERSREITVLGYLGLTPNETRRINVYQALTMGITAYFLSIVCGLILAVIIIEAINYRSFGWSVDVYLNSWIFAKNLILTLAASVAASLYPSFKSAISFEAMSLKEE